MQCPWLLSVPSIIMCLCRSQLLHACSNVLFTPFISYKLQDCSLQVKEAMAAVTLLHNHVLKEQEAIGVATKGKAKGKGKAKQAPEEGVLVWARQVSGEGVHLKKWRLILRNLPFNVSL